VTNAKEKIEAGFETAPHLQSAMALIQALEETQRLLTRPKSHCKPGLGSFTR